MTAVASSSSSIFAQQNDLALRYGSTASPTSFLALRLKGLQRNQPDLVAAYASNTSARQQHSQVAHLRNSTNNNNFSTISSIHNTNININGGGGNGLNSTTASSNNGYSNNNSVRQQQQPMSTMMMGSNNINASSSVSYQQQQQAAFDSLQNYHRSLSGGGTATSSARHTPNRRGRSPSRGINNNNQNDALMNNNNDVDAQPLPQPGLLSAEQTLAKALTTDPEAQPNKPIKMAQCHICHRSFDVTRLDRHITACQKSAAAAAKRKEFDAQELRVKKLYENDPLTAAKVLRQIEKEEELAASGRAPPKKSTWRKKSAELNNAVAAGSGSGAPMIPIADDRVPCPGCGKKFAEETAQRHIPLCVDRQKRNSFR